jgi:hypothetical protein
VNSIQAANYQTQMGVKNNAISRNKLAMSQAHDNVTNATVAYNSAINTCNSKCSGLGYFANTCQSGCSFVERIDSKRAAMNDANSLFNGRKNDLSQAEQDCQAFLSQIPAAYKAVVGKCGS